MELREISIDKINPAPYNPRVDLQPGDKEYEKLKNSILRFGYVEPCVWNERTGHLVGGHQRFKILVEKGDKIIACSVVNLSDHEEKALNLALNKTGGDWDNLKLEELLQELQTSTEIDFELTGFELDDLDGITADLNDTNTEFEHKKVEEDNFDVEEELEKIVEPVTKTGDIWQLGKHRLICGDSTSKENLIRLMDGAKAAMVFTDPPYNVDYTGKTKESLKIQNDKMDNDSFYQFLFDLYSAMFDVVEEGGAIYVCHADSEGLNFRKGLVEAGWLMKQCIIWVKNSIVMGRQDYHWQHEPILYGWKPGAPHRWEADRKQSTVWYIDKPQRNPDHPTMKPLELPAKAIQNSIKENEIVLDVCGGSGSTLLAAEQTDRICYTSELDPKYCDVIVRRYEEMTGNKAVRIEQ
ncbi:site-specific DNA-methyltransferase [Niallia taxi]|uniref:site-specific DNA-methyltransferase n=1 Tax=Niallia taxi TaxID=2499688 RepID=UPI00300921F4